MQANLSKRINQLLVLSVLRRGPAHGYQIALSVEEDTEGRFSFQHGTLYPILHRLEEEGMVAGEWGEESRRRKTYRITAEGDGFLDDESDALREEFRALFSLVDGGRGAAA